jgi:hypothetical protein
MSHACVAVPEGFGAITSHLMPSVTPKPGIQCSMVSELGGRVTNIAWAPLAPSKVDASGKVQHEVQEARTATEAQPMKPPPPSTASEAQQKLAKLRERQVEQAAAEAQTATAVQQKVAQLRQQQAPQEAAEQRGASLRAEQAETQPAQQRIAALRARAGSGDSGGGS